MITELSSASSKQLLLQQVLPLPFCRRKPTNCSPSTGLRMAPQFWIFQLSHILCHWAAEQRRPADSGGNWVGFSTTWFSSLNATVIRRACREKQHTGWYFLTRVFLASLVGNGLPLLQPWRSLGIANNFQNAEISSPGENACFGA